MARLRYNGLTAELGADLLTADTTITFAAPLTSAAGAVPTITGTDYIPLAVLDTDGSVLEIIHLTAYTTGATTGTVARAQESTTAADHAAGLRVVNGLTVADVGNFAGTGAVAYQSTAQSIPHTTDTAVTLDSELFDTDSFHDLVTNNSRLTVPAGAAGKYLVTGQVRFAINATGVRLAYILKNGATILSATGAQPGSDYAGSALTSAIVSLNAGDYIQLFAYQKSGAALSTNIFGTSTFLAAYRLGD